MTQNERKKLEEQYLGNIKFVPAESNADKDPKSLKDFAGLYEQQNGLFSVKITNVSKDREDGVPEITMQLDFTLNKPDNAKWFLEEAKMMYRNNYDLRNDETELARIKKIHQWRKDFTEKNFSRLSDYAQKIKDVLASASLYSKIQNNSADTFSFQVKKSKHLIGFFNVFNHIAACCGYHSPFEERVGLVLGHNGFQEFDDNDFEYETTTSKEVDKRFFRDLNSFNSSHRDELFTKCYKKTLNTSPNTELGFAIKNKIRAGGKNPIFRIVSNESVFDIDLGNLKARPFDHQNTINDVLTNRDVSYGKTDEEKLEQKQRLNVQSFLETERKYKMINSIESIIPLFDKIGSLFSENPTRKIQIQISESGALYLAVDREVKIGKYDNFGHSSHVNEVDNTLEQYNIYDQNGNLKSFDEIFDMIERYVTPPQTDLAGSNQEGPSTEVPRLC